MSQQYSAGSGRRLAFPTDVISGASSELLSDVDIRRDLPPPLPLKRENRLNRRPLWVKGRGRKPGRERQLHPSELTICTLFSIVSLVPRAEVHRAFHRRRSFASGQSQHPYLMIDGHLACVSFAPRPAWRAAAAMNVLPKKHRSACSCARSAAEAGRTPLWESSSARHSFTPRVRRLSGTGAGFPRWQSPRPTISLKRHMRLWAMRCRSDHHPRSG